MSPKQLQSILDKVKNLGTFEEKEKVFKEEMEKIRAEKKARKKK